MVTEDIADMFGRTAMACGAALRTIRKSEMIINGDDDDTLLTWKQKEMIK